MRTVPALSVIKAPFPHVVVNDWWDWELLDQVVDEFPEPSDPGWKRYENSSERKLEGPPYLWGGATQDLFDEIERRIPELETAFGIEGLTMETVGGGYHMIPPGGYLKVHADFNRSPQTGRYRRLNLLIYLNKDWDELPGGCLELWDAERCVDFIQPEFNRTAIFETSSTSWHGHPTPAQRWRKSVAAYFYSEQQPEGYTADHSTVWHDAH